MTHVTTPVTEHLRRLGIPHRTFTHPGPIRSLEQAAEERGHRPEQVVRSLLFRLSEDDFVMALVAGPAQVDWRALRRYLGESRLTTASQEEVRASTGYEPGAVSPFGLPVPMRVLVDESVLAEEELSIGSGIRGTTVILRGSDLLAALGEFEIVAIAKQ
ncbi:MAG: YbaK/EbsC family protein [Anaerolineae bacterium]|nr:YbaK/EbsC family protein [Anaerolineae bacterium]